MTRILKNKTWIRKYSSSETEILKGFDLIVVIGFLFTAIVNLRMQAISEQEKDST